MKDYWMISSNISICSITKIAIIIIIEFLERFRHKDINLENRYNLDKNKNWQKQCIVPVF